MTRRKVQDYWVGHWGELAAQQWLEARGWTIRHHRWHCRWGEVDLIATQPQQLIFVEVKTRQAHNWDGDGLLALTPRKAQKLWCTAEAFLAAYPDYAAWPCRFDLALVSYPRHLAVVGTPDAILLPKADANAHLQQQALVKQFVVRDYLENILHGE